MAMDVVVKLYYEEILNNKKKPTVKLQECMEKAIEQVQRSLFCIFQTSLYV
jgi:hypothetical protein